MESGYQVIARRWRPQQFDEVVGQDHIVRTLRNAIEQNRIAHAYLFVGPRGTGKTTTARLFAKALNCDNGPSITPDNDSPICKSIMAGNCMDVIEIDGASNNSVDQVRDLRDDCRYAPTQCRFKIYIIDEVHMLTNQAFNALLKTLEEPPPHVKFIFATTEANKVLPTIVSRCQRFEFRPIADEVIVEKLALIAKAEGIQADQAALASIARLANGGMRDAQSILDQLISFCGTSIAESDVLDVYGLAAASDVLKIAEFIAGGDYAGLIAEIDRLAAEGRDLFRILSDLEHLFREVLLDSIHNRGTSTRLKHSLSTESLMRILDALRQGEVTVQRGLSEKVNFEVALLRAIESSKARAIDSLIKEMTALANDLPPEAVKKKIETEDLPASSERPEVTKPAVETMAVTAAAKALAEVEDKEEEEESLLEDESGPVLSDEDIESMTAEANTREDGGRAATRQAKPRQERRPREEVKAYMLPVDAADYLDRIPVDVRQELENSYRAKLLGVYAVDPKHLKGR